MPRPRGGHRRPGGAADERGGGRELVRFDEDPRHARRSAAAQALRRRHGSALDPHGARRRLPVRLARGGLVTLRGRLLLAFGYVLVLALVALEVPLALSLRDRVDSEVRSQAAEQADLVAGTA